MSTQKFNLYLLLFSLSICAFMYADTYLVPVKYEEDKVADKANFTQRGRTSHSRTYELDCDKHNFDVTGTVYNYVDRGDSVSIGRSLLTKSTQKIIVTKNERTYEFNIGFISARRGLIYTPLVILFIIINLILNKNIGILPNDSRKYLPYIWLTATLLLLAFHLGVEYFFK